MFLVSIGSGLGFLFKSLSYEGGYCATDDATCITD